MFPGQLVLLGVLSHFYLFRFFLDLAFIMSFSFTLCGQLSSHAAWSLQSRHSDSFSHSSSHSFSPQLPNLANSLLHTYKLWPNFLQFVHCSCLGTYCLTEYDTWSRNTYTPNQSVASQILSHTFHPFLCQIISS